MRLPESQRSAGLRREQGGSCGRGCVLAGCALSRAAAFGLLHSPPACLESGLLLAWSEYAARFSELLPAIRRIVMRTGETIATYDVGLALRGKSGQFEIISPTGEIYDVTCKPTHSTNLEWS